MKKKFEKMKRIERLQKQIHEVTTWKANALQRRRDELVSAHAEMIVALGEGLLSFGGAASAATRRIRALEMEARATAAEHDAERKHAYERGMRAKAAENAAQRAGAAARAHHEKKSLEDLIDRAASPRDPVSRKI